MTDIFQEMDSAIERDSSLAAVAKLMQDSARIWIKIRFTNRYEAKIRIRQKTGHPMAICRTLWGGSYTGQKRRKIQRSVTHVWEISGKNAYKVAKEMFPFLGGAQQARLLCLIEFYEECFIARGDLGIGIRTPLTYKELRLRGQFMERMTFITQLEQEQQVLEQEQQND